MKAVLDTFIDELLVLVTFAVHEHVQENGHCGSPAKTDPGWEDAYTLMEKLQLAQKIVNILNA